MYFPFLPLLFFTISMAVDSDQNSLQPMVKKVANVSLKENILNDPLNLLASLNKADPVEVNKIITLIDSLIAAGEKDRQDATTARDNKKTALSTALNNLDTATSEHNDVAGQLVAAREEVDRLVQLEAEKKSAKDDKVEEKVAAEKELGTAQDFLDNEVKRIDNERSILFEIKELLSDLTNSVPCSMDAKNKGYSEVEGYSGCYKYGADKISHDKASTACVTDGAHLIKGTSTNLDLILSITKENIWIQGRYSYNSGSWVWDDGTPILTFHWYTNQPNENGGCISTNFFRLELGFWNDESVCDSRGQEFNYICQM